MRAQQRQKRGLRFTPLAGVIVMLCALLTPHIANGQALRPVTLQLRWTHQFQFAGYYAAKAMGYYEEAGLDVSFRQRTPGMDNVEEVLTGRAEFGVGDCELLLDAAKGKPLVVLGVIFQHAPNVILSRADSKIRTPEDLRGKRLMILDSNATALWAMFAHLGISRDELELQRLTWSTEELINGETDAMSAYLTSQPYDLKSRGIPVNTIRPIAYGIDFYGDNLFTTRQLAEQEPDLVERFADASFKGWEFAMTHPEQTITIIRNNYQTTSSVDRLRYEANAMHELILPRLVEVGSMNHKRWEVIAEQYMSLGLLDQKPVLDSFLYTPRDLRRQEKLARWAPILVSIVAVVLVVALSLLYFNQRLNKGIRQRTEELERSRGNVRQVLDLVPNIIYVKNSKGRFLLVNQAMANSLGMQPAELVGALHKDVHPDKEQVRAMDRDDLIVIETGLPKTSMEEPYRHVDGTTHWLQSTRLPFTPADATEQAVLTLAVDITNKRKSDAALKESEERFRAIFNQTYQFTCILDMDGIIVHINETTLSTFRLNEEDIKGKPFIEAPWWQTDESTHNHIQKIIHMAMNGTTVHEEVITLVPDGDSITLDFTLKPARSEEGNITLLIAEGRDISELKRSQSELIQLNEELEMRVAERTSNLEKAKTDLMESLERLSKTQEELIMSEKMAALGGLVAGVAHEINTPLGVGVTAGSYLQSKINELSTKFKSNALKKSDLERFIQMGEESSRTILTNLERAAELIKSFKQVAADQSSEKARQFNLKHYVDEVLMSLRPKYKRTEHVIENHCPDITLYSYPGVFMQIITNLLVNALTHAYKGNEAGHIIIDGSVEGDTLTFRFTDDGCGIAPEHAAKVFEPFYTTGQDTGGTGLGLHIVFNTVTQNLGGTVRLESEPGKGSRFIITMPFTQNDLPIGKAHD